MTGLRFSLALGILSSGCHVIFALEETRPTGDAGGGEQAITDALGDCWNAALVIHDEDNDGHKDGCDNCPAVDNPAQTNTDSDQLGDACDAHPDAVDTIVYWQGFKEQGSQVGWNTYAGFGSWTVENDAYRQTDTAEATTVAVYEGSFTYATIEVIVDGFRVPDDPREAAAGAYVWTPSAVPVKGAPDGVGCIEIRELTGDSMRIVEIGGSPSTTDGTVTGDPANRTYLRLSSKPGGDTNMVECVVTRSGGTPLPRIAPEPSSTGYVALFTGASTANFHSVLVSTVP